MEGMDHYIRRAFFHQFIFLQSQYRQMDSIKTLQMNALIETMI